MAAANPENNETESISMARHASPGPTEVELQILQALWEAGPSPVRVIHAKLAELRDTNYSTTVKMLAVMLEKNLIRRDESKRPHIYHPVLSRSRAQKRVLRDVINQFYQGSSASLVMQALSAKKASAEELSQIRAMLDEIEGDSE